MPHALQVDGQGHVWVSDRGNNRWVILDNDLKPIKEISNLGTRPGLRASHPVLINTRSCRTRTRTGTGREPGHHREIYKLELDGTVLGKFDTAGNCPLDSR